MSFVLETVLRSSLVLSVGLAVWSLLRHRPAALRHWVLMATLTLAAAQPAMNRVVPAWAVVNVGWSASSADALPAVHTGIAFDLPESNTITVSPPRADWLVVASRVWLAGAVVSLALLLIGAAWLAWLTSRASDADRRWQSAAEDVRQRLGIRRSIRLAVTAASGDAGHLGRDQRR